MGHYVLGRQFELAGYVMPRQSIDIASAGRTVRRHEIWPNSACDKNMLHARNAPHGGKQIKLRTVIRLERRAYPRIETSTRSTGPLLPLSGTIEAVHIGRRATNIRDNSPKARIPRKRCNFRYYVFRGAADNPSPLMNGNGTETAFPVATAVGRNAEAYRIKRTNIPLRPD